jgi:phosphonate transport system substrate-binding protein
VDTITISSLQAPNMDFICLDLARYISKKISKPVEAQIDFPWQERDQLLDKGQITLCWICGLPYVRKADRKPSQIELLTAPVMQGQRYQNRPIYFSDVVVNSKSPFEKLADLRGASWAYNEPGSQSGYNVTRYTLAVRGETSGFFGRVIESGAHQTSLQMILNGEVDSSAIDSTVLELELLKDPSIRSQIRIIDTFGPSPIPPWVVSKKAPLELRRNLRDLFCQMDQNPDGRALLARAHMVRFARVKDGDYDPIRAMAIRAANVRLGSS